MASCKRLPRNILKGIIFITTHPGILNKIAPVCYVFALVGIAGFGLNQAIPYLYSDYEDWVTTTVQCLGCFLAVELFINWLCLTFVDSTYDPIKHGMPPVLFENGEPLKQELEQSVSGNSSRQRKDAMSVTMNANESGNIGRVEMTRTLAGIDKSVVAYFTWSHCIPCNRQNPPRAHHCVLCKRCILKRDHHCYVAATCVGFRNLRYFSTFLFYAVLATVFSTVHALPYAYLKVIANVQFYELFYPVTIVRGLFGYINFRDVLLIILGWMLLIYLIFSSYSLFRVYTWITTGNTSYEIIHNIDIYDSRDMSGKLRAVYGYYWPLNFIFPTHCVFEPIDDPVRWPTFKRRGLSGTFYL